MSWLSLRGTLKRGSVMLLLKLNLYLSSPWRKEGFKIRSRLSNNRLIKRKKKLRWWEKEKESLLKNSKMLSCVVVQTKLIEIVLWKRILSWTKFKRRSKLAPNPRGQQRTFSRKSRCLPWTREIVLQTRGRIRLLQLMLIKILIQSTLLTFKSIWIWLRSRSRVS